LERVNSFSLPQVSSKQHYSSVQLKYASLTPTSHFLFRKFNNFFSSNSGIWFPADPGRLTPIPFKLTVHKPPRLSAQFSIYIGLHYSTNIVLKLPHIDTRFTLQLNFWIRVMYLLLLLLREILLQSLLRTVGHLSSPILSNGSSQLFSHIT
jgi:hypothetical protein